MSVFIPHRHCTVTSGACFAVGQCLSACRARQKDDHETRIQALERRLVEVELQLARTRNAEKGKPHD